MFTAIAAGIITAAVIVCIALLVYILRGRGKDADFAKSDDIKHINTFGVGTHPMADPSDIPARSVRVKSEKESMTKPSERLYTRFAALGVLGGAIFAALGAKLFSMQLIGSEGYANAAEENQYATASTPATRGCIYDTNGVALVENRQIKTVLADSEVASSENTLQRLSTVLGIPKGVVRQRARDKSLGAQSQSVIASDTDLRDVAYILEHPDAFPGVSVEERSVREYPYGALCAHVLGYTGYPTEEELAKTTAGYDMQSTDTIGKSGIEQYYDSVLAGDKGERKMVVDANGNIKNVISEIEANKGSDIYLTIDAHAQYVADTILADVVAPGGDIGTGKGVSASIVAMDVKTGGIAVMSSYPTFDPTYLTGGIPQDIWDLYNSEESHSPFMNRAVNGMYAPASTLKAFTSLAGLEYGYANYNSTWNCAGKWDGFGSGDIQKCWENDGHGTLDLHGGIVNSCDVVFYEIAKSFYLDGPDVNDNISSTALQEYLQKFKFGSTTGIDLEGESAGLIPTPEWKAKQWKNVPSEAVWRGGDYSNMIIGQGDVLVTPLQMACAYCSIATGDILKPHLLKEVKNSKGDVVYEAKPEVLTTPEVDGSDLEYVRDSLHDMLSAHPDLQEKYISYGIDAAAKSGTAEHTGKSDDAWFVAYAPFDDPQYVVACIVEQGGGGSDVAGPIVADVMKALFETDTAKSVKYVNGSTGRSIAVQSDGVSRQD